MAADRAQNLQDTFLNHVRKTKTPLTIFLVNGVKQQAEIVEPCDNSLKLHSIDQKDRQWRFGFANVIKEGVL